MVMVVCSQMVLMFSCFLPRSSRCLANVDTGHSVQAIASMTPVVFALTVSITPPISLRFGVRVWLHDCLYIWWREDPADRFAEYSHVYRMAVVIFWLPRAVHWQVAVNTLFLRFPVWPLSLLCICLHLAEGGRRLVSRLSGCACQNLKFRYRPMCVGWR